MNSKNPNKNISFNGWYAKSCKQCDERVLNAELDDVCSKCITEEVGDDE
jgi:hypothetical protein